MTKLQQLKRKLIRLLIIFSCTLAGMGVAGYISSDYAVKKRGAGSPGTKQYQCLPFTH